MPRFSESIVEDAALEWLAGLGYEVRHGPDMAAGEPGAERSDPGYRDVVLEHRLRAALLRLNPLLQAEAIDEAYRKLTRLDAPSAMDRNRAMHRMLLNGVEVEFRRPDGSIGGGQVQIFDFDTPTNNNWLAVNQFSVAEGQHHRRPDVVVFVNGLPLAVLELKNAADENATIWSAWQQLQTYQAQIPTLFTSNLALVISDGVQARIGALGAGKEWFKPWRTVSGTTSAPSSLSELEVLLHGVFEHRRFLDLLHYFVAFEQEDDGPLVKKLAGYHQYHAVNVAVEETLRAARSVNPDRIAENIGRYSSGEQPGGEPGDRRVGVVWHTQGSGKSLTMAFYAGRVILHPGMANPTVVVITDRNDLDEQLFGTFARCRNLLRQEPVQAKDRADLRKQLAVSAGGVIFTTIQKFMPDERGDKHPPLSDRRNVIVIADEAHRSQYEFHDGFAGHMRDALPNASFVGFTGTPIEKADANTRQVFGEYISVYDIQRAVVDGATVPIYYESRLAKLEFAESEKLGIDSAFEEVTEGEEVERKEQLKSKWAQLEVIAGADTRLDLIARDIVDHFERRNEVLDGKAMIVVMSRRIAVALYNRIVALRPEWHSDRNDEGLLKIVMTGSASDPVDWQPHIRNKTDREALATRFRDGSSGFRLVIVRDMWLTGFDCPSLATMYVDKPMRGHGLMQAIARVNRVFKDKPGGLVVDYLGLADALKSALATYTEAGGTGKTALDQEEAVAVMLEKHEICVGLFHGFDRSAWYVGTAQQRLSLLPAAQEHVLALPDGKERLMRHVSELTRAFALAVPHDTAMHIRDDVGFFQAVRAVLAKNEVGRARPRSDVEHAIRQIVSKALVSDEVIDVFTAAGLKKPDISILSDEFLAEVRGMPHRNLAVELLQKLLKGEIRTRSRRNVVQARSFAGLLEQALRRYQNRAVETAQIIEELIKLAKDMRAANARGEALGLTDDELAFYDALEVNDSAVQVLGDEQLRVIARELVATIRKNVSIDWAIRDNMRAQLRVYVKRILRKYGYPPDKQERATQTVLEQAELLSSEWAIAA
ncbi:MAG TPA: type I restriction endonuclease subunit R [Gemmatimonas aurantiaca]|uniref:Type I restriction enzyme endonuclease subunit n=2 Tax=Gemmatimonas aurantiaca TaxID=173480 RepID=C1A4R0_GEMAT|nr:type I restriction endonuclease subunit R [Gemmatimonas aurantiaca]BAH37220.1 type I restriction-modification system restriction subunit [Gemmatimonas aurantiaca T-27]HCT55636.1 type I restriction endonuclease subunit R [Gemmatimonas aurantiaca]